MTSFLTHHLPLALTALVLLCLVFIVLPLLILRIKLKKHVLQPLAEISSAINGLIQGQLEFPSGSAVQGSSLPVLNEIWQGVNLLAQTIAIREANLKNENTKLKLAFELTPIQIWFLIDPETQGLLNQTRADFLGKKVEELAFRSYWEIYDFDPQTAEKGIRDNQLVFTQKKASVTQDWFKNSQGKWRCLLVTKTPKLSADNEVELVVCTAQDITKRVRSDELVRRLSTVVEQSPVAIAIADKTFTIEYVNQAVGQFLLKSTQEVIGQKIQHILKSNQVDQGVVQKIIKSIPLGKPWQGELEISPLQGDKKWLQTSCFALYNNQGDITHYGAILADITKEKKFTEELLKAKLEAEQANQIKSEFLANISHEIRTPINAIWGMSALLWDSSLSQEQRDYMEAIRSSCQTLLQVINQILDFSKFEAGAQVQEKHNIDLLGLVDDITSIFWPQALDKGIDFLALFDPGLPCHILGDSLKLKQIMINLLGNALKFTSKGGVVLKTMLAKDHTGIWLRLEVADTGMGIPLKKQQEIFKPFVQADGSTTRKFGGTGLGLSIVKKCVNLLGGKLGLESEPDLGSCFWINLPLESTHTGKTLLEMYPDLQDLGTYKAIILTPNMWWGSQIVNQLELFNIKTMLCLKPGQVEEWLTGKDFKATGNFPPLTHIDPQKCFAFLEPGTKWTGFQNLISSLQHKGITKVALVSTSPAKPMNEKIAQMVTGCSREELSWLSKPITITKLIPFFLQSFFSKESSMDFTMSESTGASNSTLPILDLGNVLLSLDQDWDLLGEMASLFIKDFQQYLTQLEQSIAKSEQRETKRLLQTMLGAAANIGGSRLRSVLESAPRDVEEQKDFLTLLKKEFALLKKELEVKISGLQTS